MSYIKQTWSNGDTITADKLNHMENGIDNIFKVTFTPNGNAKTVTSGTINKTYEELVAAYNEGKNIILEMVIGNGAGPEGHTGWLTYASSGGFTSTFILQDVTVPMMYAIVLKITSQYIGIQKTSLSPSS